MTHTDIYTKFMIEYDKANVTSSYPSLTEYEVATVLDKAYNALIAQKVTGNNIRRAALESDLKSIEDIAPLMKNYHTYFQKWGDRNMLEVNLADDHMYFVSANLKVNVGHKDVVCETKNAPIYTDKAKFSTDDNDFSQYVTVPAYYIKTLRSMEIGNQLVVNERTRLSLNNNTNQEYFLYATLTGDVDSQHRNNTEVRYICTHLSTSDPNYVDYYNEWDNVEYEHSDGSYAFTNGVSYSFDNIKTITGLNLLRNLDQADSFVLAVTDMTEQLASVIDFEYYKFDKQYVESGEYVWEIGSAKDIENIINNPTIDGNNPDTIQGLFVIPSTSIETGTSLVRDGGISINYYKSVSPNPMDKKAIRTLPMKLVNHDIANKFITSAYNLPWIKIPVCFIEDNLLFIVVDPLQMDNLIVGSDTVSVIYIKTPNRFAKHISNDIDEMAEYYGFTELEKEAFLKMYSATNTNMTLSYFRCDLPGQDEMFNDSSLSSLTLDSNPQEYVIDHLDNGLGGGAFYKIKNKYDFECSDTVAEELISLAVAFALENVESQRLNSKLNMRGLEA